ncbi:MAG TPA: type II glyceraldehyde-3-phosphate dehydrogenase [Thermoplasmata archaeon]|nr:type II glyceraldehyde-3-phosphate dehydrogenase [Thermoplasmata archaeon]
MVVRVAVNGYGTIGKRVADAVARQRDMKLVGVTKTRPSFEAEIARQRGYPLFVGGTGRIEEFRSAGLEVAGTLTDLLGQADVVVDCAPEKVGRENAKLYRDLKLRSVFQGGEKADVAEHSFNALANYAQCLGANSLRVVSCNTTGLARAASVLQSRWGVERWDATIVRRAGDPSESDRGPINGILPTFKLPSHHGPDVRTIYPELEIRTTAVVVPTTLMHVHVNQVKLRKAPTNSADLATAFRSTARFHLFREWENVQGTPQVMEFARDRGASARPDVMENVLWDQGIHVDGTEATFFQAIHQESIVVPENVDAIRAMFKLAPDAASSIAVTDRTLGIGSRGAPVAVPA